MSESTAQHPNRFLADLTQAMRATAESARLENEEQGRDNARVYIEQLRAKTLVEADNLRMATEDDVATIEQRSKAQMDRVRQETEDRIARRRELLDQELQEYGAAIELEIERVQARVEAYREQVATFFEQLLQSSDPSLLATMASEMPEPPPFVELDRETLAQELRASCQQVDGGNHTEAAAAEAPKEDLPDHWWLDSPSKLTRKHDDQ